jgi:NADH-quinone oxidoreductase subunit L
MRFCGARAPAALESHVAHGHDESGHASQVHDTHAGAGRTETEDHHTHHPAHEAHESPLVMLVPLAVLAFGALFAGVIFEGHFIGGEYDGFWKQAIFQGAANHVMHAMHEVSFWVGFSPSLAMVLGFLLALYMYIIAPQTPQRLADSVPLLYRFLLNKWYFDELYDLIFVRPAFWLGRLFWKGGDGRIIDGLGPDGVSARVIDMSRNVVRLQTGYVYHYAFAMLIGVAAAITYYLLGGVR